MSIKSTRWDFLDSKTKKAFEKLAPGGVLPNAEKRELATLITRPSQLIQRTYQLLQKSDKLNTDQKRFTKYLMMYVNNANGGYGDDAADKDKPCSIGYALYVYNGMTGFPLETLMSMRQMTNTGEGSLLDAVYGIINRNELRTSASQAFTENMNMQRSIYVREAPDLMKVIQNLNPNMIMEGQTSKLENEEIIKEDLQKTPPADWTVRHYKMARKMLGYLSEAKIREQIVPAVLSEYDKNLSERDYMQFKRLALMEEHHIDPVTPIKKEKASAEPQEEKPDKYTPAKEERDRWEFP